MSKSLFSPSWYRVASLKPRIRAHAEIHRHEYRGQIWFVLQDHASGRYHRFAPAAQRVIGLMDGKLTVQAIWATVTEQLGDEAPTQDEVIQLLGQLHGADVLQCDVQPDTMEVFQRHSRQKRQKWMQRIAHPLAIRIPVFDPDGFLNRTVALVRPLFGWLGFCAWLLIVIAGVALAVTHWADLTENIVDRVLTPENLLVIWLAYPLVKVFHELGHAYATKTWGGEVHEIGVIFLVLIPIPYVEASAASAFRDKRRRMVVGAIGIMVELFLASLALFAWLLLEPGYTRAFAYNVMLIGGVSTLFFNGNPLLRFDGYYVLADALEIPNFAARSRRYLGYLVQRYGFGMKDVRSPATARGEASWFFVYGIASFIYRMFILAFIALFVASKFFIVGVLLALWAVGSQIGLPLWRNLSFLFTSPSLKRNRFRAVSTTVTVVSALVLALFLVPVPLRTHAQGVVWLPESAHVRAQTDGFVIRVVAQPNARVHEGDVLVETEDPELELRESVLRAQLRELEARFQAVQFTDRAEADVARRQMSVVRSDLARAREQRGARIIRSPRDGVFLLRDVEDLPGRLVKRGQLVAYVTELPARTVRVVVAQNDIGLVREGVEGVEVTMARWGAPTVEARVARAVPAGGNELPSAVLASSGGGLFVTDPRSTKRLQTFEKVFQFDVELPVTAGVAQLGARAHVQFDHGAQPLAGQWYRSARQLFLSHFGV